jgi:DNA polymerase-3 subunit gamma/tau
MSLAFYRKYRPQKFSDLVGQEHLVEILRNAARKGKISHAYLLYGNRGSGKTTTARLIAKIANCHSTEKLRREGEACGKCLACQQIDSGQALDVIEIDAASNRGIDEIRNLKEGIKLSPSSLRKKVFIIDEAHMLTKEAFNALLKTLEEPPEHAILILATTEYEKIPSTISSRTQKFYLKKFTLKEIVSKLQKIVLAEKLKIEDDALELIASSADGSLRDAESLLDQMSSLTTIIASPILLVSNQKDGAKQSQNDLITVSDVEKIIGQIGFKKVLRMADLLIKRDLAESLEHLNQLQQDGYNLINLNKELITYLRKTLSLKLDPQLEKLFEDQLTKEELNHLKKHSQLINTQKQISLLKSLIRAHSEMRYSPFPQTPLEIAIIENLQI